MTGSEDRLAPWLESPATAGVLTDFDGTLSPIVDQPEAAVPLPGAAEMLARLARHFRLVAVISGRPVAYLVDRLGPSPGVTLVGLYGLEKWERGVVQPLPRADRWRSIVAEVAAAAEAQVPSGVHVERKGLTVGLHFRKAPEHAAWTQAWAEAQAARTGLVVHHGKMALELVPPVGTDKGSVVHALVRGSNNQLSAVCYLGDDLGDLPAFAALERLAAADGIATLAVAVRSAESPPELLDRADVIVEGPEGAAVFLDRLAAGAG